MKTAQVLAAGLALASSAALVSAVSDSNANDVLALNYALQLEHLESDFYSKGLARFTNAEFGTANIPTSVRDYLILIGEHEKAHVTALTSTIENAYSAEAGSACSRYAWSDVGGPQSFSTVDNFLATAITLEDTGVGAYTAALNHITNKGVQEVAATIATIEARHAAFLRANIGKGATADPFPFPTNPSLIPDTVVAAVVPFLSSDSEACSYSLASNNLPAVRPTGVATNNTLNNFFPSSVTKSDPAPVYTADQFTTDLAVLNYALTLEHLEANFYNSFAGKFSNTQFSQLPGQAANGAAIVANIVTIGAHENAHVDALKALIAVRGGVAVTSGCYDWSSITTAADFIAVADVLENTGVSAYDGAANLLTDTGLQNIAASVATVEARHAAYLNNLNNKTATNQNYMGGVVDQPLNMTQIVNAVSALKYVIGLTGGCGSSSSASIQGSSASIQGSSAAAQGSSASNQGSSASSNTDTSSGPDDGGAASFTGPAVVTAAIAFVAALLF